MRSTINFTDTVVLDTGADVSNIPHALVSRYSLPVRGIGKRFDGQTAVFGYVTFIFWESNVPGPRSRYREIYRLRFSGRDVGEAGPQ